MDGLSLVYILVTVIVLVVGGYFVYQDRKPQKPVHKEKHA